MSIFFGIILCRIGMFVFPKKGENIKFYKKTIESDPLTEWGIANIIIKTLELFQLSDILELFQFSDTHITK